MCSTITRNWWRKKNEPNTTLSGSVSLDSNIVDFDLYGRLCNTFHMAFARMEMDTGPKATNLKVFYLFITFITSNYPVLQTFLREVDGFLSTVVERVLYNYHQSAMKKMNEVNIPFVTHTRMSRTDRFM